MKHTVKIFVFFIIPLLTQATPVKGKYVKEKTIHKTFTVASDALLKVNNEHGNIDIVTWNRNETRIDITIKADGNNEDVVAKRLNDVRILFDSDNHYVSAKTTIKPQSSNWSFWKNSKNASVEVHYQIKIPVNNKVHLINDYGSISINRLKGSCIINCDYGAVNIGELLNESNKITMDYGAKSTIEYLKQGSINVDYTSLHIEQSEKINVTADYSHLSFGTIEYLDYHCDYGSLKIENVTRIKGNSDYMHATIKNLSKNGDLDANYGSIKIKNLEKKFNTVRIKSDYTSVKIGSHRNNQFNTKINLEFGHLKYNDNYVFPIEKINNFDKYYEGFFNTENAKSNLIINSDYGNITLY